MATGIGNAVLITVSLGISVAMFVYMRRKLRSAKDASDAALCLAEEDKRNGGDGKCQKSSGLVCFEGGEELRLESLLKASAEVLGKGVSGSTYKAVLEDGIVVAVKRLSALQFPPPAGARRSTATCGSSAGSGTGTSSASGGTATPTASACSSTTSSPTGASTPFCKPMVGCVVPK